MLEAASRGRLLMLNVTRIARVLLYSRTPTYAAINRSPERQTAHDIAHRYAPEPNTSSFSGASADLRCDPSADDYYNVKSCRTVGPDPPLEGERAAATLHRLAARRLTDRSPGG